MSIGSLNRLFSTIEWNSVSEDRKKRMGTEIADYDADALLNTSVEDLSRYFETKYRIEIPELLDNKIAVDQRETQIDVSHDWARNIPDRSQPFYIPGTLIEVTIPFEGDAEVFIIRPTTFATGGSPFGEVKGNSLLVHVSGTDLTSEKVRSQIDGTIKEIERYLGFIRRNVEPYNDRLYASAKEAINRRRNRLLDNQNLVANLGYPLKKRKGAPRTYVAPDVRRKIRPKRPTASTDPFVPEPALTEEDYNHILDVIQNMALVMERSPSAFKDTNEEALRTHFLVQLNGHYEGAATGETFNYNGKTDILIRVDDKNIFIAECKFWGGSKKLTETIDQILRYSSWRDTKTAIILFSKNKNFTAVIEKIPSTIEEHPNFKRNLGARSETVTQYLMSHQDDPNRELTLTVLAFDVPSQDAADEA